MFKPHEGRNSQYLSQLGTKLLVTIDLKFIWTKSVRRKKYIKKHLNGWIEKPPPFVKSVNSSHASLTLICISFVNYLLSSLGCDNSFSHMWCNIQSSV